MKRPARTFADLLVWRRAHSMALTTYSLSANFPRREMFGLTAQLRRAAVSVPANIAEGFRRRGLAEKVRFLNIAQSSLEEVRYYFILATDLGYADCASATSELEEVSRMLHAYSERIRSRSAPPDS